MANDREGYCDCQGMGAFKQGFWDGGREQVP